MNQNSQSEDYAVDETPLDETTLIQLKEKRLTSLFSQSQFALDDRVTDGVAVTTYGRGQLSGVTYTVPAHGEITVDFTINMQCVTPEDVATLSALIRSLLEASKQSLYDEFSRTDVSGGASFFGFFGWGGASASYTQTKHRMESMGLSEANQRAIVEAMMSVAQKMNTFHYTGTIYNKDNDYSVSGNMFGIVMDCDIQQSEVHNQVRFLAPKPHLQPQDGTGSLPVVGKLYPDQV